MNMFIAQFFKGNPTFVFLGLFTAILGLGERRDQHGHG